MATDSPHTAILNRKVVSVSTKVDLPFFVDTDDESTRLFLSLYDWNVAEVTARARKLAPDFASTEPVRPVDLVFCVNPEYLESSVLLGIIEGVTTKEEYNDLILRHHMENKAAEYEKVVSLESLNEVVLKDL